MKTFLLLVLISITLSITSEAQEKNLPKLSALMFGDYFYNIDQRDSSRKDLNGFQFRRIYFTADYTISEKFDTRFRLEADQTAASLTGGGRVGVMVKDAYLRWKNIFTNSDFIFGISPTPYIDAADAAWGYRSLEKTVIDFNGVLASRDFGVDLRGKFNDEGTAKYWIKIANNSVNAPEINKHKRYYGLLQFFPVKNFQLTVYGDFASYPLRTDPLDKQLKNNDAAVAGALLNLFEKDNYSIGIESFYRTQQNNFSPNAQSSLQSQNAYGVSVWAWTALNDLIRIVGRYDIFDPNTDHDNDRLSLILGGLDFVVDKNVSIIPNVESVLYQGTDKKDLIARITFAFQFL